MPSIADPRVFPLSSTPPSTRVVEWQQLAELSANATGVVQRAAADATLERSIASALAFRNRDRERGPDRAPDRDLAGVAEVRAALDASRSASEYRQLWRAVVAAWRMRTSMTDASVAAHGFAIPVVVVTTADADIVLPMTLGTPQAIVDAMHAHDALGGNRNFGVGSALGGERTVGLEATALWPSPDAIVDVGAFVDAIPASPVHVVASRESAHLRWIAGSAIAAPSTDLFTERSSGKWGLKAAETMSTQLAGETGKGKGQGDGEGGAVAQVLALPGAPSDILSAWQQGVTAHREVALQLYASSALRKLRSAYGEPGAVISAHRTNPGELRISLSSPFGERDAEGFRCPLFPFERIDDVMKTITDLLEACRVTDVIVLSGLYADREKQTGLPLFFRADALPDQNAVQL